MRKVLFLFTLLWSLTLVVNAQEVVESADLETQLRFAASQHEIIKILLDEDRYADVLPEFWKILDLELTGDDEKPVVQEAWLIGERMRETGQYDLAHELVDGALDELEASESQFHLLMLKGKIFQDEGLTEEALAAYREAQLYKDE
jgi:tetratricopeptide (TPR) repeat protein